MRNIVDEIRREKIRRTLRSSARKEKAPAIYGVINRRIAASYGAEPGKNNLIQYR